MNVEVMKFGGTSVANIEKMKEVASFISKKDCKVIVVVSAMNDETDKLIQMSKQFGEDVNKRELDMLLSTGEQKSAALMAMALNNLQTNAISLNAFQLGIVSSGVATKNKIEFISKETINRFLKKYDVLVVTGFQGVNENLDITTLGRGGSDTTCICIASALNTNAQIFTDIDGVYATDPRICPNAIKYDYIDYDSMMEMSVKGSGVMEVRSVEIAKKYNIDIVVGKSLSNLQPTIITSKEKVEELTMMEKKIINGVSVDKDVMQINISNYELNPMSISQLFNQIAKADINVDMISQNSSSSIAMTCPSDDVNDIVSIIKELNEECDVEILTNLAKISLVGIGMNSGSGVASRVFEVLSDVNASFYQISTSEITISILIDLENADSLVQSFVQYFGLTSEN